MKYPGNFNTHLLEPFPSIITWLHVKIPYFNLNKSSDHAHIKHLKLEFTSSFFLQFASHWFNSH